MTWIVNHCSTILISLVILGMVVWAVRCIWKDKKSGKSCGSCGGCSGCAKMSSCHTKEEPKKEHGI